MKVLHVITGLSRRGGGPSRSSQGLVAGLCRAGVDAWLYTFSGEAPWIPGVRELKEGRGETGMTFGCLDEAIRQFDLVHLHGLWNPKLHRMAVLCRKAGVPYVIAPRGMLEPWSLKQKWLKKRLARFLYQDRDLRLAAALHATAESEAAQFRKLGFKNKIIIAPNGVNVPSHLSHPSHPSRRALFVSRMHPKKGVLELVESWARVKPKNWQCELVYTVSGGAERDYEQKVKQRILDLGMSYQDKDGTIHSTTTTSNYDFIFTGALDDEKKWDAYARADLFVLPTYSENFGIVVAEALWAGVPVITTKGTPWREVEECRCGWWIDLPDSKVNGEGGQWRSLDFALKEACGVKGACPLSEMGVRGRRLIESKYTWKAIVGMMKHGYEQALNDCEFAPCDSCRNYGDTCPIK